MSEERSFVQRFVVNLMSLFVIHYELEQEKAEVLVADILGEMERAADSAKESDDE